MQFRTHEIMQTEHTFMIIHVCAVLSCPAKDASTIDKALCDAVMLVEFQGPMPEVCPEPKQQGTYAQTFLAAKSSLKLSLSLHKENALKRC